MSKVNKRSHNEPLEKTGRRWVVGANAAFFILSSIYFSVAFLIIFFEFNGTDNYSFLGYIRESIPSIVPSASLSSLQKPAETVLVFAWIWGGVGFVFTLFFTDFFNSLRKSRGAMLKAAAKYFGNLYIYRTVFFIFSLGLYWVAYTSIPVDSGKVEKVHYFLLTYSPYGVIWFGAIIFGCICVACFVMYVFFYEMHFIFNKMRKLI